MDFKDFLLWERESKDTIDFKKIYVDMADGDVVAGLALSEIIYWYLPSKDNKANKLRVIRDEQQWIAIRRKEWWERTRLTPRQSDRALGILIEQGLIIKDRFKFAGELAVHIRLDVDRFLELWQHLAENPQPNPYSSVNSNLPNGEIEITNTLNQSHQTVKSNSPKATNPNTETTPKNTQETSNNLSAIADNPLATTQNSLSSIKEETTTPESSAKSPSPKQIENNRRADIAIAHGHYLGADVKRVDILRRTTDKVATDYPELTGAEFAAFLKWYQSTYPDWEKLRKPETISSQLLVWLKETTPKPIVPSNKPVLRLLTPEKKAQLEAQKELSNGK